MEEHVEQLIEAIEKMIELKIIEVLGTYSKSEFKIRMVIAKQEIAEQLEALLQ